MRVDWSPLFGYDIFLSYKRGGAPAGSSGYARRLKERLAQADFQCFLDEDDAPAGEHLTPAIRSSLRRSKTLVVLCTREALRSDWVTREVQFFSQTRPGRKMIPVQFEASDAQLSLLNPAFVPLLENERIWLEEQDHDEPSDHVVGGIQAQFNYRRANWWRKLFLIIVSIILAIVSATALYQWRVAVGNLQEALRQKQTAENERQVAIKEKNEAEAQRNAALARQLTTQSNLFRSEQRLDVEPAALLALESMLRLPSLEADYALRESIRLLPRPVLSLPHRAPIEAVGLSPDNRYVATVASDELARVFEISTGHEMARFPAAAFPVLAMGVGNLLVEGGDNNSATVYNYVAKHRTRVFTIGKDVTALAFSQDARLVAVGCGDGTTFVFEVVSGRETARFAHKQVVRKVAFNPDATRLTTISEDNHAHIFDLASHEELRQIPGEPSTIPASGMPTTLSADGQVMAFWGTDSFVRIFSIDHQFELAKIPIEIPVYAAFGLNGRLFATADGRATRVFDAFSGVEISRFLHRDDVWAVAMSLDGQLVASGSIDGTLQVFSPDDFRYLPYQSPNSFSEVNTGNSFVAARVSKDDVAFFDYAKGRELLRVQAPKSMLKAVSADGHRLALEPRDSGDYTLTRVVSLPGNKEIVRFRHSGNLLGLSSDGSEAAVGYESTRQNPDSVVQILNIANGKEIHRFEIQPNVVDQHKDFPATGTNFDLVQAFQRKVIEHDRSLGFWVTSLKLSKNGQWMAVATDDDTAHVFETASGKEICRLSAQHSIWAIALAPNARQLATLTSTNAKEEDPRKLVRVYDCPTGSEVSRINSPDEVLAIEFDADGHHLITIAFEPHQTGLMLKRHSLLAGDLINDACARLTRNFSSEEWKLLVGPGIPYRKTCPTLP